MIRLYCRHATLEKEIEDWLKFLSGYAAAIGQQGFRARQDFGWSKGYGTGRPRHYCLVTVFDIADHRIGLDLALDLADRLEASYGPDFIDIDGVPHHLVRPPRTIQWSQQQDPTTWSAPGL